MFGIDPYQAAVGKIVGPIHCEGGWHLLRLDNLLPATLDESTISALQERVLEQWLENKVRSLQVELCLSEPCLSEGHLSAA
jgi:parvulin-like peptidyl-prolyl isomerase